MDRSTIYWLNRTADGGVLDVDGFGPESIAFADGFAAEGVYAFAIHKFSGSFPTTTTLSVFANGALVATYSSTLSRDDSSSEGLAGVGPLSVFSAGTVTFPRGTTGPPVSQNVFIGES